MTSQSLPFNLAEIYPILEQTPATVTSLLQNLPMEWVHANEGGDTWSAYDIVGHYIHGEQTDWIPRIKLILSNSTSRTFEPFDRFAQFEKSACKSLSTLLETFKTLRNENLHELANFNLTEQDLSRTGNHPTFGVVTLKDLLSAWVVHDLSHINQISRVLAKQYQDNVGPWKAFMLILTR